MHIDQYSEDEFLEVVRNVLQFKDGCSEEVAEEIANGYIMNMGRMTSEMQSESADG